MKNFLFKSIIFTIYILPFLTQQVFSQEIQINWKLGITDDAKAKPESYFTAKVPGAVQLDYIRANKKEPYYFSNNVTEYKKLEGKYWHYKCSFKKPNLGNNRNLIFSSKGIDYEFDIILNDSLLLHQEGMFTPVELVLDENLKENNILKIVIYPIPIARGEPEGRNQARFSAKPPVPYGWDWHPRLVPVGIWDETTISVVPQSRILKDELSYELYKDFQNASIKLLFSVSESNSNSLNYTWNLYDATGEKIISDNGNINNEKIIVDLALANPKLWWPHDHGHYLFFDKSTNEDVFQVMSRAKYTAYTEFGIPSLAPVEILKQIIPNEELFPVEPTEAWKIHGGFDAWLESSWLEKQTIEKYFGKAENIQELVWQSQTLQSIGYKAIFEEARRQKPFCSMALNWCFNEPWPNAANNNLVSYPNNIKPAFYAVAASLRPVISSAAFKHFNWKAGENINFDLWMLNDTYQKVPSGAMDVYITINSEKIKIGNWSFKTLLENENLHGPTIRFIIPQETQKQLVKISLEVQDNNMYNSEYFILINPKQPSNKKVSSLNF